MFWINVPIGLGGALLAPRMLAEARRSTARRLDVKGAIAVTAGASLLVFTFIHAEQVGWASAQAIVSLAAALGLLGAFVMIDDAPPSRCCRSRSSAVGRCRSPTPG